MRMYGCGALPSRILKPGSCEIQNLNRIGVGSLKTLIKMYFRCVISVPPFVPSRPLVPPTFFSDLAFLFSFSANFFGGEWLFYLSLLTLSLMKGLKWSACIFRCVRLSVTPWSVALQAPLFMGFSRQ